MFPFQSFPSKKCTSKYPFPLWVATQYWALHAAQIKHIYVLRILVILGFKSSCFKWQSFKCAQITAIEISGTSNSFTLVVLYLLVG